MGRSNFERTARDYLSRTKQHQSKVNFEVVGRLLCDPLGHPKLVKVKAWMHTYPHSVNRSKTGINNDGYVKNGGFV